MRVVLVLSLLMVVVVGGSAQIKTRLCGTVTEENSAVIPNDSMR